MNTFFITVKQGKRVLANKVAVSCERIDLIKTAKLIRKKIADDWHIKPSNLDWAAFDCFNPDSPYLEQSILEQSKNFQCDCWIR